MEKKSGNTSKSEKKQADVIEKFLRSNGYLFPQTEDEIESLDKIIGSTGSPLPESLKDTTFLFNNKNKEETKIIPLTVVEPEDYYHQAYAARDGEDSISESTKSQMVEEIHNPLLMVLSDCFGKSAVNDLTTFHAQTEKCTKWTCYSDYCFDDKMKPNSVVTYTFIPYIDDFVELKNFIQTLAQVDIKKTRSVKEEFVSFLKSYPLVNVTFILNDRKKLLGENHEGVKQFLKDTFEFIKDQYTAWMGNQLEQKDHYRIVIKHLKEILHSISQNKKIDEITDMMLVTFLGAYVSKCITQNKEVEVFGWFSDRDAINEVSKNFSIHLFHYYFHTLKESKDFKFVAALAGSVNKPFYDEFIRIPDYIAGTLADYDIEKGLNSKEKFKTMLTEYMADNTKNNFVFKLYTKPGYHYCSRVTMHKKEV